MKTIITIMLFLVTASAFAQVNPNHNVIVCSGANGASGDEDYEFSEIFKGPAWGEGFGFDENSLEILGKTVQNGTLTYSVKDVNGAQCKLAINLASGNATLSSACTMFNIKYRCVSLNSNSDSLEVYNVEKKYKLPYEDCKTVDDPMGPYTKCLLKR